MDGNGRWAASKNLPREAGHRRGVANIPRVVRALAERGVSVATLYAFSTENWRRPTAEVEALMSILAEEIQPQTDEMHRSGVRIVHLGDTTPLDTALQYAIAQAELITKDNDRFTLNVAFNYGGRDEILHAVRRIIEEGVDPDEIDESVFGRYLYTDGCPDPDLIIRTGGEQRLSNFLIGRPHTVSTITLRCCGPTWANRNWMRLWMLTANAAGGLALSMNSIPATRSEPLLLHRVLTAMVAVPIILAAIWSGPPWITALAVAAAVVGVWEAYRMYPLALAEHGADSSQGLPTALGAVWSAALVLAGELAAAPLDFAKAMLAICVAGCIVAGLWMIAAWRGKRPLPAGSVVMPDSGVRGRCIGRGRRVERD